mmetsp:Transcript_17943/g.50146  ORF Transcript_17943/g.50146 Transcript_17943/m.50146 type:complete len:801 (+) Transcript_17943:361-2763(+)
MWTPLLRYAHPSWCMAHALLRAAKCMSLCRPHVRCAPLLLLLPPYPSSNSSNNNNSRDSIITADAQFSQGPPVRHLSLPPPGQPSPLFLLQQKEARSRSTSHAPAMAIQQQQQQQQDWAAVEQPSPAVFPATPATRKSPLGVRANAVCSKVLRLGNGLAARARNDHMHEQQAQEETRQHEDYSPTTVVAPRVQQAEAPRVQQAQTPRVPQAEGPRVPQAERLRLQQAQTPGVQQAEAPHVQQAETPCVQEAEVPHAQQAETPRVQQAQTLHVQEADGPAREGSRKGEVQLSLLPLLELKSWPEPQQKKRQHDEKWLQEPGKLGRKRRCLEQQEQGHGPLPDEDWLREQERQLREEQEEEQRQHELLLQEIQQLDYERQQQEQQEQDPQREQERWQHLDQHGQQLQQHVPEQQEGEQQVQQEQRRKQELCQKLNELDQQLLQRVAGREKEEQEELEQQKQQQQEQQQSKQGQELEPQERWQQEVRQRYRQRQQQELERLRQENLQLEQQLQELDWQQIEQRRREERQIAFEQQQQHERQQLLKQLELWEAQHAQLASQQEVPGHHAEFSPMAHDAPSLSDNQASSHHACTSTLPLSNKPPWAPAKLNMGVTKPWPLKGYGECTQAQQGALAIRLDSEAGTRKFQRQRPLQRDSEKLPPQQLQKPKGKRQLKRRQWLARVPAAIRKAFEEMLQQFQEEFLQKVKSLLGKHGHQGLPWPVFKSMMAHKYPAVLEAYEPLSAFINRMYCIQPDGRQPPLRRVDAEGNDSEDGTFVALNRNRKMPVEGSCDDGRRFDRVHCAVPY